MPKTSKDLSEFGDMYDAIKRAMSNNTDPLDFIAELHDVGFMIVAADAVMFDLTPGDVRIDDGAHKTEMPRPFSVTDQQTAMPIAASPPSMPFPDWLAAVKQEGPISGTTEAEWKAYYDAGTSPRDAYDAEIPF